MTNTGSTVATSDPANGGESEMSGELIKDIIGFGGLGLGVLGLLLSVIGIIYAAKTTALKLTYGDKEVTISGKELSKTDIEKIVNTFGRQNGQKA